MMTTRMRLLRDQQGQSAVEIAVVAPLLMLLLTGVFSYGIALMNESTLQEATGAGGRKLAISRAEGGDPCALAAQAVAAGAPLLSNTGSAATGLDFAITINNQTYSSPTPQCSAAIFTPGQPLTIATTYPCTIKLFKFGALSNCMLSASVTEVIQ